MVKVEMPRASWEIMLMVYDYALKGLEGQDDAGVAFQVFDEIYNQVYGQEY